MPIYGVSQMKDASDTTVQCHDVPVRVRRNFKTDPTVLANLRAAFRATEEYQSAPADDKPKRFTLTFTRSHLNKRTKLLKRSDADHNLADIKDARKLRSHL